MSPLDLDRQRLLEATTALNQAWARLANERGGSGHEAALRHYQRAKETVRLAREAVEVELGREGEHEH